MVAALLCHHPYLPSIRFSPSLTRSRLGISIRCSDSNRGFDPKSTEKAKDSPKQQSSNQAPGLSILTGGARKTSYTSADEFEFEQRLQAIRKSALEQKEAQVKKEYGAIDYDAPTENNSDKVGLLTSVSPAEKAATVNKISEEERAILAKRLKEFEEKLATSPEDSNALEGAAVTLAEMQDYERAATFLEKLTEKKPRDPDVFRLLGEVKYELKDYERSVLAYRSADKASESLDFEILRGLTNSLLAAKKPDEAVQMLLAARERLNKEKSSGDSV